MIMKFDFRTGEWLFLGCEPGREEYEIISEVIRQAEMKGYEKPTPGLIANRIIELYSTGRFAFEDQQQLESGNRIHSEEREK